MGRKCLSVCADAGVHAGAWLSYGHAGTPGTASAARTHTVEGPDATREAEADSAATDRPPALPARDVGP
eukprot:2732706-Alexandrium_andersonii.AAC.1